MSSELLLWLKDEALKLGATDVDLLYGENVSLSVGRRMRKPEELERSESAALGLRVFVGQKLASVSGSDMKRPALLKLAQQAVAMAKASPEDPFAALAPKELLCKNPPDLDLLDANEPSAEWLQAQCEEAEEAALGVKGVTNSEGAQAGYSRSRSWLLTSNGFEGSYATSGFSISMTALAGEGTGMERDYDYTSVRHRADLRSPALIGKKAGELAARRLGARKPQTQQVPVVYHPRVARGMAASLSGAINGSSIARGTSFLKGHLGKKIFASGISIIDDPLRKRGLASWPFDGEGVTTRKRAFIEDGVLTSWLLDIRSAKQLGMETTGNASRGGFSSPPSPSSSNLYLEAGKVSPEELMSDIKSGFYVTDTFGSGANLVTGDYSVGASGFWIENGVIAYPVNEVTIAGTLLDMFARIAPANDLEFRYGINAPTLRIDGLTVAGK